MEKQDILRQWLKIDYDFIANKIGFMKRNTTVPQDLIYKTIRLLDRDTTMSPQIDINYIITVLGLMWEHIPPETYSIKEFILKIMTRIGYAPSAVIADKSYDYEKCAFSMPRSILNLCTFTMQQSNYDIDIGNHHFLLTQFQKELWDVLFKEKIVGISAPTSAGKSFLILLNTSCRMLTEQLDVIYIIPTLSLLNQVTEDYNNMLQRLGVKDFLITNSLSLGESKAAHTIYIWTQEKAISALTSEKNIKLANNTVVVVDEVQNIERINEDEDIRSKVLFDVLQELRHSKNIVQIILSGPRIKHISQLGKSLFGKRTMSLETDSSPVANITYSIKKAKNEYYLNQYCAIVDSPHSEKIENSSFIAGCGTSSLSNQYLQYLSHIGDSLSEYQNIFFAPTSSAARKMAIALGQSRDRMPSSSIDSLINYYKDTIHPDYSLCVSLQNGVAYHHGKLPIHVRRTLEYAMRERLISNVVCTTTLMQGVNLPAQNIIIRNPHLYTRHQKEAPELTSYEMANLRGRAGRLLKDFIGRTIVLDEGEFSNVEGYDKELLFDNTEKIVSTGYGECFEENKDSILDAISSDSFVNQSMGNYGHLVTYIRQSVLRHGYNAVRRMGESGVYLTKEQVAAIKAKLNALSVPKHICISNRYWDPFVLDDIYNKFQGEIPVSPGDRGTKKKLSDMLRFLRDNESTKAMYQNYIPSQYQMGRNRGLLCSTCLDWANEVPLKNMLDKQYFYGDEGAEHIEAFIKLLQETVSYNVPLLIKPIIEMKDENSMFITCLQAGAFRPYVKRMIEIGIPRELAIKLGKIIKIDKSQEMMEKYDLEVIIREKVRERIPDLDYWEQVQLSFLKN